MPTHRGTQTIETPRLLLRRATVEDAQAMFDHWASDPQVTRYLMWPKAPSDVAPDNAAGVLFDYLNTRHKVLRPTLRRTFIGSDTYIP